MPRIIYIKPIKNIKANWYELKIDGFKEVIVLNEENVKLPDGVINVGDTADVAGTAHTGDDFIIKDATIQPDIEQQLRKWILDACKGSTGEMLADKYKKTMALTQSPHDGKNRKWVFSGAWVHKMGWLLYQAGAYVRKITVEISYDKVEIKE